jgi:hypothetical protein
MNFFFFFFCLGWPATTILPISASQLASMTGVSHWDPVLVFSSEHYNPVMLVMLLSPFAK